MTRAEESLEELKSRGGIVKASDWTNGWGMLTKGRAIPAGAARFERNSPKGRKGCDRFGHTCASWTRRKDIAAFFAENPRVRAVIAVLKVE